MPNALVVVPVCTVTIYQRIICKCRYCEVTAEVIRSVFISMISKKIHVFLTEIQITLEAECDSMNHVCVFRFDSVMTLR